MPDRSEPVSKSTIFNRGAARFNYLVYLGVQDRSLTQQEVEHTRFIGFQRGQLAHMGDRNWKLAGMCLVKKPTEKLVAIGEEGQVFTYVAGKSVDEVITPQPQTLRGIGVVDGYAYACGMSRQVYKRSEDGVWLVMSAPLQDHGETAGFEAIAGFSENEIYAVGWNSEIWNWNGSEWRISGMPSDIILTSISCSQDKVAICGQAGKIILGRHETWKVFEASSQDDFWDVLFFNEKLYVSTLAQVFTFENEALVPVDFKLDEKVTCGRLTQAQGVLWSIGQDHVLSYDGQSWTKFD